MNVRALGNSELPLLFCVPGLMGDVQDFEYFAEIWKDRFHVLLPQIADAKKAAQASYAETDANGEKRLLYESTPHLIAAYLKSAFPDRKCYFAGISLGGKITIEIAGNYPELFAGAVITDVGLGPLCASPLFEFVSTTVPSIHMDQPWPAVRQELVSKIPDKMLRLLVQSHIDMPNAEQPHPRWRPSSFDFPKLVSGTILEDQWRLADKIPAPIHVLKATVASGLADGDFERMKQLPAFRFHELEGANHFIQVYNREAFARAPFEYLA